VRPMSRRRAPKCNRLKDMVSALLGAVSDNGPASQLGVTALDHIWLEKLSMSEYAQRFADNAIDLSVLPDLTDQDLEKIGVLLGHRRKAIAYKLRPNILQPSYRRS
jgi:SAM domain (Sterile alpha motif)